MASKIIKGLTIEIGGDTTKLGKALQDVESKSRNLSKELGGINRLLKMDPGNTELLAQKQKVLAEAVSSCAEKLETLREAEKQVQEQFKRGEVSEEQVRELQREIVQTEQKMQGYQKAAKETAEQTSKLGKAAEVAKKAASSMGSALATAAKVGLKAMAAASAAAAVGAAALAKTVVSSYADYEQLVGGIDTLFKESSGKLQDYANNAYKTAGLSANEYMETATSFSASLISSLGGDTEKAVEYANLAITDMSDNANKMGTDMESIQNAYQGFAKQNYTMLDNLKLGYGGTKEEMQRLLKDAEKISGVKYDLSSYADVVQAIHVMQQSMGIAGATAQEAEKTISGSVNSAKAALTNLVTGMGTTGANISQLCANVTDSLTNVINNIAPVLQNITAALPQVAQSFVTALNQLFPMILPVITSLFQSVLSMLTQLLPTIVQAIVQWFPTLINTIAGMLPMLMTTGVQLIACIIQGVAQAVPQLTAAIVSLIPKLTQALVSGLPQILQAGIQLLMALVQAVPRIIPSLVAAMPQIFSAILSCLVRAIPQILQGGLKMLTGLVQAVPKIIPQIVAALPQIIRSIISTLISNIPQLIQAAIQLFMAIVKAIPQIAVEVLKAMPQIIKAILQGLAEGASSLGNMALDLGKGIVTGLWNGIKNAKDWLIGKVKGLCDSVLGGIKSFFGINSPSKVMADEVGKWLPEGMAQGVIKNTRSAVKAMQNMARSTVSAASDELDAQAAERNLWQRSAQRAAAASAASAGYNSKLDAILAAIERGSTIMLDGTLLVGGTANRMDATLGQRRALVARGAL